MQHIPNGCILYKPKTQFSNPVKKYHLKLDFFTSKHVSDLNPT